MRGRNKRLPGKRVSVVHDGGGCHPLEEGDVHDVRPYDGRRGGPREEAEDADDDGDCHRRSRRVTRTLRKG